MSGQPRPTRPRSISVLTPADLGGEGDPPPTPHATLHPRSHADDSPPRFSVLASLSLASLPPPPEEEATPPSGLAQRQGHPTGPARRVQGEGGGIHRRYFLPPIPFLSLSVYQPRLGKEETRRMEERKVEEEGVISVGRAGCIRSNIMQAHNRPGCVGSPSLLLLYALLHAQRVRVHIYIFSLFPFPSLSLPVCLPFVCTPLPHLHRNRTSVEPRKWP